MARDSADKKENGDGGKSTGGKSGNDGGEHQQCGKQPEWHEVAAVHAAGLPTTAS